MEVSGRELERAPWQRHAGGDVQRIHPLHATRIPPGRLHAARALYPEAGPDDLLRDGAHRPAGSEEKDEVASRSRRDRLSDAGRFVSRIAVWAAGPAAAARPRSY